MRAAFSAVTILAMGLCVAIPQHGVGAAPSLAVLELATKGLQNPGPYLLALNRRGPMLATCYGSREATEAAQPFEVFMEVDPSGLPMLVNLQVARGSDQSDRDACLLEQFNKARFPQNDAVVELRATVGPEPVPEPKPR